MITTTIRLNSTELSRDPVSFRAISWVTTQSFSFLRDHSARFDPTQLSRGNSEHDQNWATGGKLFEVDRLQFFTVVRVIIARRAL